MLDELCLVGLLICRFGKMVKKVKGETHNLPEEEDRVTKLVAANEIGSEEGPIHDTPLVDDVQPNEEEGDEDEGSSIQTLTNSRDTKVSNMSLS